MLYMYIGGGAVSNEQSYLLGSIVVRCKNRRWAALICAAARIAGLASNDCLGPLDTALLTSPEEESGDSSTLAHTPHLDFWQISEDIWQRLSSACDDLFSDVDSASYTPSFTRSTQSEKIGFQLASWASAHSTAVSQPPTFGVKHAHTFL